MTASKTEVSLSYNTGIKLQTDPAGEKMDNFVVFKNESGETVSLYKNTTESCTRDNCRCVGSWVTDKNESFFEEENFLMEKGFSFYEEVHEEPLTDFVFTGLSLIKR